MKRQNSVDLTGGQELWASKDLRRLDEDKTLQHNWQAQWEFALAHPAYLGLCKTIVANGGPILEVAAGPGGGNLSPVKHLDPGLPIIVNDIDPRILARWSRYLSEEHPKLLDLSFAAFDACSIPLPDDSLSCVSSAGGISTLLGSHAIVLKECARVLQPGGIVAAMEMVFTQQCLQSLPGELVNSMVYHPWLFGEWPRLFAASSLTILSDIPTGRRLLDPEHSALAIDAASYGTELEVEYRCIVAKKRSEVKVTTVRKNS